MPLPVRLFRPSLSLATCLALSVLVTGCGPSADPASTSDSALGGAYKPPWGHRARDAGVARETGTGRDAGSGEAVDAGASQGASSVCGTWALVQADTQADLDSAASAASISSALSTVGVKGLSLRVPWTAIYSPNTLAILDDGLGKAGAHAFAVRFISGVWTPPAIYAAGASAVPFTSGTVPPGATAKIPVPWDTAKSTPTHFVPNTVFEEKYEETVEQLATYARANDIHELHMSWFSGLYSELYEGKEIAPQDGSTGAPNWSYANWLRGHEDLIDIAMKYAGTDLVVEFPITGLGPDVDGGSADGDLIEYASSTYGTCSPHIVFQSNNLKDDTPTAGWTAKWTVFHGRQMFGEGNYDWDDVYAALYSQKDETLEIYTDSFSPALPDHAKLLADIAKFGESCPQSCP